MNSRATASRAADDGAAFATLPQWWRARCREWADRPALRHKRRGIWRGVGWAEYFEQARAIGLALAETGMRAGETVSILAQNRPEWLFADLGAQATGFVVHGLLPGVDEDTLERRLAAAGTRVLVVEDAEQLVKALAVRARCPTLRRIVVIEPRGLRAFSDSGVMHYRDLLARGLALAADSAQATEFERRIDAGHGGQIAVLAERGESPPEPIEQSRLLHRIRDAAPWLAQASGDRSLSFTPLALLDERVLTIVAPLAAERLVHFPEGADTVGNDLREVAPPWVLAPLAFWEAQRASTDQFMAEATPLARGFYRSTMEADRPAAWRRLGLRQLRGSLGLRDARAAVVADAVPPSALVRWYAAIGVPMIGTTASGDAATAIVATAGACASPKPPTALPG